MSKRPYIPIDTDNLPEIFEFDIGEESFNFGINYNSVGEFFTVDLYDINMNPIILGEVLVIDTPLWQDSSIEALPLIDIIPMDEAGNETVITKDNFGSTVFLYIDVIEDNNEVEDSDE